VSEKKCLKTAFWLLKVVQVYCLAKDDLQYLLKTQIIHNIGLYVNKINRKSNEGTY